MLAAIIIAKLPASVSLAAERFVPNLAACTQWSEIDNHLYTRNTCDRLVTVNFTTLDEKWQMIRTLAPNQSMKMRVTKKTAEKIGWISSTCPAGYKPTVSLAARNRMIFQGRSYDCVRN